LTLLVLVYTIGDKSGAHVNPAVTVGLMFVGRFPFASGIVYIVFQVLGALLGRLAAWPVADQRSPFVLATDTASIPPDGGFLGEFFGVVFLMFAVMAVVSGRVERSVSGLVIGIGLMVGLAATGGILNPAIGLVSLSLFGTIMPFLGAVVAAYLAVFALRNVRPPQR
jgi:glycerol uptake facilitator protein